MGSFGHNLKSETMNNAFYVLDTVYASDIRLFAGGQVISGTETRCSVCNSMLPLENKEPIRVALSHLGKQGFAEYLWNSHSLPIFRADLVDLWLEAGLSGFITKPVQITGWFEARNRPIPETIPIYYYLITTSYIKLVEPPPEGEICNKCGFTKYRFPKIGNRLPYGLSINHNTWDGTDFFGLVGYTWIFCSCRVLEVTLPKRYKHIAFIHTSNWNKWEPFDIEKWTPKAYDEYVENFLIRRTSDLKKNCS